MGNLAEQVLMQRLATGMRRNKGFTLIEILIVIVIIGITIGFALLAFGDFGESKRIIAALEQVEKYSAPCSATSYFRRQHFWLKNR